jgi:hypothetical protein
MNLEKFATHVSFDKVKHPLNLDMKHIPLHSLIQLMKACTNVHVHANSLSLSLSLSLTLWQRPS